MPPWANRLLHVLASAPALAAIAIAPAPVALAQEPARPVPIVVAVDPGHGGVPDNAHPEVPFDPGAVGAHGLLEKDLTLDIAQRLRALLAEDLVQVVMTREADRFVSVEDRSSAAQGAGATLFVSIHLNSWIDPSVGGSLVLFPGPRSAAFATVMSQALQQRLAPLGVENKGTELRDNWWIHASMPVVTVEGAYVTNPQEAGLLSTASFRQSLAQAIRDGVEAYEPAIGRQKTAIAAWNATHPAATVSVPGMSRAPGTPPGRSRFGTGLLLSIALGLAAAGFWYRRRLMAWSLSRWQRYQTGGVMAIVGHRPSRRHRQLRRPRTAASLARGARPHSVYDDLWF